jgi:hypothetical protein
MTEEPKRTQSDPATLLESDLAEIRTLLREAVKIGRDEGHWLERRTGAMAAASRLFAVAINATATIVKIKNQNAAGASSEKSKTTSCAPSQSPRVRP